MSLVLPTGSNHDCTQMADRQIVVECILRSKEKIPYSMGAALNNHNDCDFVIVNILSTFVFEPITSR